MPSPVVALLVALCTVVVPVAPSAPAGPGAPAAPGAPVAPSAAAAPVAPLTPAGPHRAPPAVVAPAPSAAAGPGAAVRQSAEITSLDLYGLRTVDPALVRETLGFAAGEAMTADADTLEARLAALPGVAAAEVALIRYPGHAALFVGVREEGVPEPRFRAAPTGKLGLDPELRTATRRAGDQLIPAIQSGQAGEDHVDGYALSQYEPLRAIQRGFVEAAEARLDELVDVLRHAADPGDRAAAATIVAYGADKPAVAAALQHAADDPDEVVRNNAVRALGILAAHALEHPELGVTVDPAPFLQLIASLSWTDRNKGAAALASLSRARDPALLAALAEGSLDELAEMAVWHSHGHAGFALQTLARVAGVDEETVGERLQALYADQPGRVAWVAELRALVEARREEGPASGG